MAAVRRAQNGADSPSAGTDGALRAAAMRRRPPAPVTPPGEASLSLADRMTIQFDLAWTGDYNGLITGDFTDRTAAAVRTFQRNRKFKETGVLNTQERAVLAALAKAKQAQVGWSMVDDAVTGARLGLPTRQVPIKSQSKGGSRWSSTQGQVQIETFKIRESGTTLASVYERQKKEPAGRKLNVDVLRDDFFVLSGAQGAKNFYVRAEFKDGEVRGMTLLYDQTAEPIMDPVAVVMSSSFAPFPRVAGAVAQQVTPQPKRKVEYGTGIVVSTAGHIVTDRQLTEGCNVIVVSGYGDADRQADDKSADLALLRVYGATDLVPAAFTGDMGRSGDLTLVGVADPQAQGGGSAISTAAARLRGEALDPAPQLGFSGAAALDNQGRFAGLVALKTAIVAAAGAAEAQPQANVVPAQAVRAFIEGQKLPAGTSRAGIEAAMASVVRVICVRK
jgi:peptidoglycan hydrolase-like protein with peptidoglycan-binding domain